MQRAIQYLSSPRRREILRLVWSEELPAGEIHRRIDAGQERITFGAVSQHLTKLTEGGLVTCRPEGRFRFYSARPDAVGALRPWLESMWADALVDLKRRAESLPPE